MPSLFWSEAAEEELAEFLVWLIIHQGGQIAEAARAAVEKAALSAAEAPLSHAWIGALFDKFGKADQSYRRVLAWKGRLHLYYRYIETESRVVILHVRGTRRRPLSLRQLARGQ